MHRLVFAVALLFGALFAVLTPPFATPDETGHWIHAVAIANGESWLPKAIVTVPAWSRAFVDTYTPNGDITKLTSKPRFDVAITNDQIQAKLFNLSTYNGVGYLPAASGVLIARMLRLSPLATFRAGRIAATLISSLILFAAFRIASGSRALLTLVALAPMAVALRASYSIDGLLISLAILLVAVLLSSHPSMPLALLAATLIVLLKPPYLPLAALAMFATSSTRRRVAVGSLLVLTASGAMLLANAASKQTIMRLDVAIDPAAQVAHIAHHPFAVTAMLSRDLVTHSWLYTRQAIGILGWMQIELPAIAYQIYAAALALAVLLHRRERSLPTLPVLLAILATLLAIAMSVYILDPVAAARLDGFQGRYLLPVIPFLALLPSWKKKNGGPREIVLAVAVASVVLIAALREIVVYYATTTSP